MNKKFMSEDNVAGTLHELNKRALEAKLNAELKDHAIAQLVNDLTATAREFAHTQMLREQIRAVVFKHLGNKP